MLKKYVKQAFLLILALLPAIIVSSEIPYDLMGLEGPFELPPLGISTSSTRETAQRKRRLDIYLTKQLNHLNAASRPQIQALLRGLIQFILLEAYQYFTLGTPIRTILLVSYTQFFRDYILSQPGATLQEQLDNALRTLNNNFRERLSQANCPENTQNYDTLAILLYALHNLPELLDTIFLRNEDSSGLFEALDKELENWWGSNIK